MNFSWHSWNARVRAEAFRTLKLALLEGAITPGTSLHEDAIRLWYEVSRQPALVAWQNLVENDFVRETRPRHESRSLARHADPREMITSERGPATGR